jgi:Predicted membrane protein, hemolysin III homolog
VDDTPQERTREEIVQEIKDAGVPTMTIGDNEVPLYGLPTAETWALINLICCIAGGILAIGMLVAALVRRKKKDEEENPDARSSRSEREDEQRRKRVRPVWLLVSVILGIVGVIVFALTEDMNNVMVFFDNWTIVMAIILGVEIVGAVFTIKRDKKNDEDDSNELEDDIDMFLKNEA